MTGFLQQLPRRRDVLHVSAEFSTEETKNEGRLRSETQREREGGWLRLVGSSGGGEGGEV